MFTGTKQGREDIAHFFSQATVRPKFRLTLVPFGGPEEFEAAGLHGWWSKKEKTIKTFVQHSIESLIDAGCMRTSFRGLLYIVRRVFHTFFQPLLFLALIFQKGRITPH